MADKANNDPAPVFRRIVLKLSGESFNHAGERGISMEEVLGIAKQIFDAQQCGCEIAVVIGGGNILRGSQFKDRNSGIQEATAHYMGMLATVINALAVQDLLEHKEVATRVMTAIRMEEVAEPYIRRKALRHMEKGRVVLFAGGTGNPYFSTDTAAVLRAIEMGSQVVIKATKVKGIYSADPTEDPSAEFIPSITFQEVVQRELAVMDQAAVSLCKENGLPIIVLNLENQGADSAAVRGDRVGTLVS